MKTYSNSDPLNTTDQESLHKIFDSTGLFIKWLIVANLALFAVILILFDLV